MDCIKQDIEIGGMTSATEAGRMVMDREAWCNNMHQMARQSEEDARLGQSRSMFVCFFVCLSVVLLCSC